jgi:16S rRNA (cytosine967-C5)-methyltransferase
MYRKINTQISFPKKPKTLLDSLLFYIIYRKFWEDANTDDLWSSVSFLLSNKGEKHFLKKFLFYLSQFNWQVALKSKNADDRLSIAEAMPSFLIEKLKPYYNFEKLSKNLAAMNDHARSGRIYFWVNSIQKNTAGTSEQQPKTNPKFKLDLICHIEKTLNDNNINFTKDKDIANLYSISITQKSKLLLTKLYQQQEIVIQQKPSLATIYILNAKKNDRILDMCSAPGTKLSYLYSQIPNAKHIIANDFHRERLLTIPTLQLPNSRQHLNLIQSDGIHPPFREKIDNGEKIFDKVLIDAPCTGSGTFASNPELKWRQNPDFLRRNVWIQENILKQGHILLKKGGILVYSTCSLYYEENEAQILKISHQFEPMALPKYILPSYLPESHPFSKATGRFYPHDNETIGYFVTKLRKI